ncbi:kelch repeat-containing protein [Mariniflexile litorale]|uniref:Kelch repeat-containing protein n=1 Tax=Mariniflexile litorale TaxID=3045158 RepID=A0AAU7ECS7_9FLAO|nr:kelch repeat-containing protein [Mariniflexile sp. KMM 9835]MDQ8212933.1 hypothetical protein [Mariniflexile sp. KMM 9835]
MKILILSLYSVVLFLIFTSCSNDGNKNKDDTKDFTLSFNVETNQDQMGDFSHNKMVVFNNEVWSVGGLNDYNTSTNSDVWKSTNGVNWVSVTSDEFPNRVGHTLTVFDNKMWVIGGFTENDSGTYEALSDVWYSSDGENWTLATNDIIGTSTIGFHSTIAFDNKLYLIKDGYYESAPGCTVWSSSDGMSWARETDNAFPYRDDFSVTVFNNEIYVTGGSWGSNFFNEIWKSSDGINWTQVSTSGTIFSPRASNAFLVYENKLWVFGGRNGNAIITGMGLWYSNNGEEWFRYEPLPAEDGLYDFAALNYNNAIWVFGGLRQEPSSVIANRVGTINTITQD